MRAIVQMRNAEKVIKTYDGAMPLHYYLKNFFREHKEMGSKDRKFLQQLVYEYFRLCNAIEAEDVSTKIALAHYIIQGKADDFSNFWLKEKAIDLPISIEGQENIINAAISKGYIHSLKEQFPLHNEVSNQINQHNFFKSILQPPLTWIRCKKDRTASVIQELNAFNISYIKTALSENAIGFKSKVNFDDLIAYKKGWFEVQDLSSQLTGNILQPLAKQNWWDCCAASGGKSLLLKDIEHDIQLTVSDNRDNILKNLKDRFHKASIAYHNSMVLNLEQEKLSNDFLFDAIIVDAPCSGSGTWGRNPERMSFFKEEEIAMYQNKQEKILDSIVQNLKPKGKIIYITCSVYAKENEMQVAKFCQAHSFKTESMTYLKGYEYEADTMFVAVLRK